MAVQSVMERQPFQVKPYSTLLHLFMELSLQQKPALPLPRKKKINNWNSSPLTPPTPTEPQPPAPSQHPHPHPPNPHSHLQMKKLHEMATKYHIAMEVELGSGFASVVYAGENIHTRELVCVKVVDCMHLGAEGKETLYRQIKYLQQLDSPRIVRLLDGYESPSFCYLVMEFCRGGDLFRFLMKSQPLHPLFIRQIVLQITQGLALLKQQSLLHRDLKTENIFLSEHFQAKIGDLGFCVAADEQEILHNVGSPIYMSPEVLSGHPHSYSSDIYGLGIIWYELLHRVAPWQAKSEEQLLQLKQTQPVIFLREDVPEKDRQMIERCLRVDPAERCSIEEVLAYCQSINSEEMKAMMQLEIDKQREKQQNTQQQVKVQVKEESEEVIGE